MIKTKKKIGIFSVVITFILLCTFALVPFVNKNQTKALADAKSNLVYAFVSLQEEQTSETRFYVDFGLSLDYDIVGQTEEPAEGEAEGENQIVVDVEDAKQMKSQGVAPFEYATVYIRTRNLSAIAEAGDYEAIDQQYTLYGTDPYATLAINTTRGGLRLNDRTHDKEGALRDFVVEIYKVEIVGLKANVSGMYDFVPVNTTTEISSDKISLAPEYTMTTEARSGGPYGNAEFDLQYIMDVTTGFDDNDAWTGLDEITETDNYPGDTLIIDLTNDRGNNVYNHIKYLSEHNMMKLGIQIYGEAAEQAAGYVNNCYVGLQVFSGDANKVGAPDLEDVSKEHIYTDPSVKEIARWYIKFQSDRRENMDLGNAFNGKFEGVTVKSYFDEGIFISESIPDGRYGQGGKYDLFTDYGASSIFVIDDLESVLDGGSKISARAWTYYNGTKKTSDWTFRYKMMNYRAEVSDATFSKVYYDKDGKAKLGLSLRFSEPMQLPQNYDGTKVVPSIDAYINNRVIEENKLDFQYLSGEGTDTFYFEAELPEVQISSIRIGNPHAFENIYDYASYYSWYGEPVQVMNVMEKGSSNKVNGWDKISELAIQCSYDLRKPNLVIETGLTNEVKKAHPITIRTENISETGRLYYGWSTRQGEIPEQISVAPILASGTQTIPSPSGISGTRYLYAVAVSDLEKRSDNLELYSNVAFHFDNEAPTFGEMEIDNAYKEKTFTIPISNNSITGFENYAGLKNSIKVVVSKDKDATDIVLEKTVKLEQGSDTQLNVPKITFNFTITAAEVGLTNESELKFATYYISFAVSDVLENRTVTEPQAYYFDIRDVFQVELVDGDPFGMEEFAVAGLLSDDYYTLDLSRVETYGAQNKKINVKFRAINSNDAVNTPAPADDDTNTDGAIESIGIEEFVNVSNGTDVKSNFKQETGSGVITMTVETKFAPGLYRLVLKDLADNSSRKTLPIYFYVTNGKVSVGEGKTFYQDVTYTPQNAALTNKVFQIPTEIPYHYLTAGGVLTTESYSGSNKPASFSSEAAALSYIRYKEYLDLCAITLDQTDADNLNRGFLRKAERVTQRAEAGQVWIRYKEENWRPNTTTTNWVYYYYGADETSLPINVNALSNELQIALVTVSNYIRSQVKAVNLVTEDVLDKYGSPMLSTEQIPAATSSPTSKSGTVFADAIDYPGDEGMYYSIDGNLALATNTIVGYNANSRLYYKEANANGYSPLISGETFGECIQSTGMVTILELSDKGAFEYFVFIDNEEPVLNFSIVTSEGSQTKSCSMKDNGTTIRGGNVYMNALTDHDDLAFVAIYKYTGQTEGDLLYTYRKQDFDNGQGLPLEDGKYHVQVSDRSGNAYTFVLFVKSDALVATVTEVGSSYIRLNINRDEEEILSYKVFLGETTIPITTDYDVQRFMESGDYRFEIEDKYGNKKVVNYSFNRTLPTVQWRYKTDDNNYLIYDPAHPEESKKLTVEKVNDQNYKLFTSTYLSFLPLDGCIYEIISGTPNASEGFSSKWVTLNQITSFTMKVYYETDPDVYVIYTCVVDNTAPRINVSYEKATYELAETSEILQKFEKGEFINASNDFSPSFIGFTANAASSFYVSNGERVESKYFKVQISDDYGVRDVKIYLDGEWINPDNTNFTYTYLSRRGTYTIVATDDYGNSSTFTFTNEYVEDVEYFVDGEKIATDVAYVDYFDGNEYTKVEYGNSGMEIKLRSSAEVHYLITDSNGKKKHFAFVVKDGVMYTFQYVIEIVEGEYGEDEIENIFLHGKTPLKSGIVAELKDLELGIYLTKNNDGSFSLTVSALETVTEVKEKTYTVETRVSISENESPYYFKTQISTIPSLIDFVGENAQPDALNNIKVSGSFEIDFENIGKDVQTIEVAQSKTGDYTTYETIYISDKGVVKDIQFTDEKGKPYVLMYYHIKVVNVYGIQMDYYVMLSSQFSITAKVEYSDGTSVLYDEKYEKNDFYSNKSVELIASSNDVKVTEASNLPVSVTKMEQGYTVIYIDKPGDYTLTIIDEYGNVLTKNVSIQTDTLTIDEELLIGFNEKALRRDENYTNQPVYVSEQAVTDAGIKFISMRYQKTLSDGTYDKEVLITLYDQISQSALDFDATKYVGALGDGKYTLVFRDGYGNKAETVIYYRGTPSLTIKRTTLNGIGVEAYDLQGIQENGVWTNDSVTFSISATQYILTVDGLENVTSISYDTKTKNEYDVYYLDEYGFEYTFKVYLHREEITIAPAEGMSITQPFDVFVTKDNVQMLFTETAYCSYTINNETEKAYNAGDVLYKDGIYRFKVVDKAGNVATYTVKKDSAVEYRLEGSGANEVLINGGITNGTSVKFYAENSDNAYIKKVFHNNEFIEYNDTMFTERGKWELIVADDAGNESYFRFYILHGKLDGFLYNVPYNYEIVSVMWEMENSLQEATETIKDAGLRLEATENGTYTVTMQSMVTGDTQTFTFTIDKTPPHVALVGCEQNEKTINDVTLDGCAVGDTIYIYKDDKLIKTVRITSDYMNAPTITDAGKYKILIKNEAGLTQELVFERKYVPNIAGSVLIIILSFAAVAGFFVGLIWRNHSKTDD